MHLFPSGAPKDSDIQVPPNLKNYITDCKSQFTDLDHNPTEIICLLCDSKFILPTNEQDFLTHLFQQHQLVIGDVEKIASLKRYKHNQITKLKKYEIYINIIF